MNHNPNCDGDHCVSERGEVRVLPTGGDSNAILCRACFDHEISYRTERNLELDESCRFALPEWSHLTVYGQSFDDKLAAFAALLEQQQRARFQRDYPGPCLAERTEQACKVSVKTGGKYVKVDVGTSGKYMVVRETGEIYGIKAYAVIHRGHQYGTLDTLNEWDWSGYVARPLPPQSYPAIPQDTLAVG